MSFQNPTTPYEKAKEALQQAGYKYYAVAPVLTDTLRSVEFFKKDNKTFCLFRDRLDNIGFYEEAILPAIQHSAINNQQSE